MVKSFISLFLSFPLSLSECSPSFLLFQQGCVHACPPGYTASLEPLKYTQGNWVVPPSVQTCQPCAAPCLTCAGLTSQDCLSCPPHNHLDPVTGTCLHQNQIERESPDTLGAASSLQASSGSEADAGIGGRPSTLDSSSRMPVIVAILSCAFIVAAFVAVFAALQLRTGTSKHHLLAQTGTGLREGLREGFRQAGLGLGLGTGAGRVIAYKGIPSVWREDGSESEVDEFDIHNERTAFIKTQSAL